MTTSPPVQFFDAERLWLVMEVLVDWSMLRDFLYWIVSLFGNLPISCKTLSIKTTFTCSLSNRGWVPSKIPGPTCFQFPSGTRAEMIGLAPDPNAPIVMGWVDVPDLVT